MEIRNSIAQVFQDAQISLSGHRKLVINLKSIYNKSIERGFEEGFTLLFTTLLNKMLILKKGEDCGDRIAKFCSVFIANLYKEHPNENERFSEEESPHSRFVDHLIRHLLQGIQAKDRNVRYRVVQLLAYLVNFIGELDEELFKALNWSLGRRLYDKEPSVRIQAVVALSRFQFIDFEDDDDDNNKTELGDMNKATKLLIEILDTDDSPEVRRAALLNLNKTSLTISYLIEAARDVNSVNRRLVYSRVCKELGDFRAINDGYKDKLIHWGLNDRDALVSQSAIRLFNHWFHTVDKDFIEFLENITLNNEKATLIKKIFDLNFDTVKNYSLSKDDWKSLTIEKAFLIRNLYEYYNDKKLFDLIEDQFLESIELSEVLYKYLRLRIMKLNENKQLREDYNEFKYNLRAIEQEITVFNDKIGELETLEKISKSDEIKYKNLTTSLADFEQKRVQFLTVCAPKLREYREFKEDLNQLEFIIHQLLLICLNYDFSDEISRRSLLQIVRSSLTNDELSDELIEVSLKVMIKISVSQRDFTAITTEIITDIRDSFMDENDETFYSVYGFDEKDDDEEEEEEDKVAESQEMEDAADDLRQIGNVFDDENFDAQVPNKRRKIEPKTPPDNILIQCLQITQHLLSLTNEPLEHNVALESLIASLVIPAMSNPDPYIKSSSIKCLGLFCLLDKELAIKKLGIFKRVFDLEDEMYKVLAVKIFVDILSTFGTSVLEPGESFRRQKEQENNIDPESEIYCNDQEDYVDSFKLGRIFYKALKTHQMMNLQSVVAEGLCKLFLADIMDDFDKFKKDADKELLTALVISYFDERNKDNTSLQQTLSFCLPVYAFSHGKHQMRLAKIMDDCILRMFIGDSGNITSVVQQLIHWCDHENLVRNNSDDFVKNPLWQIVGFLKNITNEDINKSVRKALINNLSKINLTKQIGSKLLVELKESVEEAQEMIDNKQGDEEFSLDAFVMKSLRKFYHHVQELIDEAEVWENTQRQEIQENESQQDEERNGLEENEGLPADKEELPADKEESQNDSDHDNVDMEIDNQELKSIDIFLDAQEGIDYAT